MKFLNKILIMMSMIFIISVGSIEAHVTAQLPDDAKIVVVQDSFTEVQTVMYNMADLEKELLNYTLIQGFSKDYFIEPFKSISVTDSPYVIYHAIFPMYYNTNYLSTNFDRGLTRKTQHKV